MMKDELVNRGDVISAINRSFARYKIVEESHGEKHVKWTEDFIKFSDVLNTVKNIPSKQMQEEKPFEDCISRHDAIDALMEILDRPNHAEFLYTDEICKVLNELPSVRPVDKDINVSCKDAISRQAAIRIASGYCHPANVAKELAKLPSVQPYTDEEIQKIQELEQAQLDKAFELGKESAKAEIVRCGQCKYAEVADAQDNQDGYTCQFHRGSIWFSGSYCSWAERRTDDLQ